jgi:hypothetical protein
MLDAAGDAEAVHRLEAERLQDQEVEGALNDVGGRLVHVCPVCVPDRMRRCLDCQDVRGKRAAAPTAELSTARVARLAASVIRR